MLQKRGINADGLIVLDSRPTTIKTRIIAHSQQVVRVDRENVSNIPEDISGLIVKYVSKIIKKARKAYPELKERI